MRKKMIKREATWRFDCYQVRILRTTEIRLAAALVHWLIWLQPYGADWNAVWQRTNLISDVQERIGARPCICDSMHFILAHTGDRPGVRSPGAGCRRAHTRHTARSGPARRPARAPGRGLA